MLNVTGGLKVYLAVEPADMRKGFGGLYALALLLDGVDLKGAKMRPWYQRE